MTSAIFAPILSGIPAASVLITYNHQSESRIRPTRQQKLHRTILVLFYVSCFEDNVHEQRAQVIDWPGLSTVVYLQLCGRRMSVVKTARNNDSRVKRKPCYKTRPVVVTRKSLDDDRLALAHGQQTGYEFRVTN